jgi:hypothetical protein
VVQGKRESKNIVVQGKRHKAQGNCETGETSGKSKKGERSEKSGKGEKGFRREPPDTLISFAF